jgi:hypothetical protein
MISSLWVITDSMLIDLLLGKMIDMSNHNWWKISTWDQSLVLIGNLKSWIGSWHGPRVFVVSNGCGEVLKEYNPLQRGRDPCPW